MTFAGPSATECEAFVHFVITRAHFQNKSEDNEWITKFVRPRLLGEALRWYCLLPTETKKNWELLAAALLREYPRASKTSKNNAEDSDPEDRCVWTASKPRTFSLLLPALISRNCQFVTADPYLDISTTEENA